MAGYQASYDYANTIRDLSEAFKIIVKQIPTLSALIGAPIVGMDGNPIVARATKHEWLEDTASPQSFTVNDTRAIAGGTLVLTSTVGVKAGMVFGFRSALGASKTVQLIVSSVTNGTDLAVAVYGGSTDVQLVATDVAFLIGTPKNESTSPDPVNGYEPTAVYNYTQIFDRTAKVSKTAEAVRLYGIASALDYQVTHQLWRLAYEMNNAIIYGRRVLRDGSNPGSMNGILAYMEAVSGNQVDASGAAISPSLLNDGFEQGFANGATAMRTIVCAENQARKISGFNSSGNNPIITRDEKMAGSYVTSFVSDLPIGGQGQVSQIVVDPNFPKDKVLLLDVSQIGVVPLQGRQFTDVDAAGNGDDFFARRVLGEYTLEFRNAATNHIELKNLEL